METMIAMNPGRNKKVRYYYSTPRGIHGKMLLRYSVHPTQIMSLADDDSGMVLSPQINQWPS